MPTTARVRMTATFVVIMLWSTLTALAAPQQQDTSKPQGTLSGTVLDAVTKQPLAGATVTVVGTNRGAVTRSNGKFTIQRVPAGIQTVRTTLVGYQTTLVTDVAISPGKPYSLDIEIQSTDIELNEVVVVSEAFRKDNSAISSTQLLTSEEVRRAPGVQEDVVRAIALLPGVAVTAAGRNDLAVRGGAPFENLFIVDNIEVPNINHFGSQGSSGGPLSLINIAFVKDVSLSTGGFGPRYGDRLSSVTNLQLREGNNQSFAGELNLSATGFGAIAEGPLGSEGTFLVSARRSYLDLIFKAAGFGFVPEYWDFSGKFTYNISDNDKLTFLTIGALDQVTFNNTEDNLYDNSRVTAPSQNQYFSGLTWRHLLSNGVVTTTLGRTFTAYNTVQQDSLGNDIFRTKTSEGDNSLRTDVAIQYSPTLELNAGAILRYASNLDYQIVLPGFARLDSVGVPAPLLVDTSLTAFRAGVYGQADFSVSDHWKIVAGARVEYYGFLAAENTVFSPRATVLFSASPTTTLRLGGGRYYQAPQFIWLVGDRANPDELRPLRADQIVAGWEWIASDDLKLQVEVYHKWYGSYPVRLFRPQAVLSPAGFDDIYNDIPFGLEPLENSGTGRSYGIELYAQKKLSEAIPIYGLASISINRTEFTANDGVVRVGTFDTPIIGTLAIGWRPSQEWEIASKVRVSEGLVTTPYITTSDRAAQTGFPVGSLDFAFFNQGDRLPTFFALDLRIDKRWFFSSWQLITYIDVQNITNRENVGGVRYNTQTGTVENQTSIGVLPSIGVNIQF